VITKHYREAYRTEVVGLHACHNYRSTEEPVTRISILEKGNDARIAFITQHEGHQVSKFETKNREGFMGVSCENRTSNVTSADSAEYSRSSGSFMPDIQICNKLPNRWNLLKIFLNWILL
jgi:hypothetical protein